METALCGCYSFTPGGAEVRPQDAPLYPAGLGLSRVFRSQGQTGNAGHHTDPSAPAREAGKYSQEEATWGGVGPGHPVSYGILGQEASR